MAHELEVDGNGQAKMFFVGETPWHGLGKKLDKPPTVKEAITCAQLDFTVNLKQLVIEGTETKAPAFATVRDTDNSILGIVGTDYKPVQNIEAFDWFQPWIDSGQVTLETAGSLKGGRHIWVLAKINRDPVEIVWTVERPVKPTYRNVPSDALTTRYETSRLFLSTRVDQWIPSPTG